MIKYINKINNRENILYTNILLLRFNQLIIPEYFCYFTQGNTYSTFISKITKPAVNQASFTTKDFKKMLIQIPPLSEQCKITNILSEVDAKIEKEEATKAELEQLKKGLMQVLLTGKVRVKA